MIKEVKNEIRFTYLHFRLAIGKNRTLFDIEQTSKIINKRTNINNYDFQKSELFQLNGIKKC